MVKVPTVSSIAWTVSLLLGHRIPSCGGPGYKRAGAGLRSSACHLGDGPGGSLADQVVTMVLKGFAFLGMTWFGPLGFGGSWGTQHVVFLRGWGLMTAVPQVAVARVRICSVRTRNPTQDSRQLVAEGVTSTSGGS